MTVLYGLNLGRILPHPDGTWGAPAIVSFGGPVGTKCVDDPLSPSHGIVSISLEFPLSQIVFSFRDARQVHARHRC